jgi:predicted nucleic acid-binding Zn ribbon protein
MIKFCIVCGKRFVPKANPQKICGSQTCKLIRLKQLNEKRRKALLLGENEDFGRPVTSEEAMQNLALAVIMRAKMDATSGNEGALEFLEQRGGDVYAQILNVHPDRIRRWAQSGFQVGGGRC